MGCKFYAANTKALISCAISAQPICSFGFAYAKGMLSGHMLLPYWTLILNKKQMGIVILSALPES